MGYTISQETAESRSAIAMAGKKIRTHNISKRVQKIIISPIKEMSILADDFMEQTGADVVSFGQGIPYFDTPLHIKKAVRGALRELSTAQYTLEPGINELRHAIAQHLEAAKCITNVQGKKEVMVTVGCQEAVACAMASTIDEGDEVLLPSPCFASHIEQVIQFGGIPKFVPLIEDQNWKLDIAACGRAITPRTKVILFSNPSNPTGAVMSEEEIRGLAKLAQDHDLIIIADETYDFLTYDGVHHISPAFLVEIRDRVIVCGSFSKKYAMTGYRVGYAFADEGIVDHMLKVHDALTICCPAISQKAALAALNGSQECVQDHIARFEANKRLMCNELNRLSEFFEYNQPKGSYYILAKVKLPKPIPSFKLALRILHEAHVIVIPGAAFGPNGEGHLRFSFAGPAKHIKTGFERIETWFKKLKYTDP